MACTEKERKSFCVNILLAFCSCKHCMQPSLVSQEEAHPFININLCSSPPLSFSPTTVTCQRWWTWSTVVTLMLKLSANTLTMSCCMGRIQRASFNFANLYLSLSLSLSLFLPPSPPPPPLPLPPPSIRECEHGYWPFVSYFTRRGAVQEINNLPNVTTDLGRGEYIQTKITNYNTLTS